VGISGDCRLCVFSLVSGLLLAKDYKATPSAYMSDFIALISLLTFQPQMWIFYWMKFCTIC